VSFLLSGMSTMDQVEQNLAYADRSRPGLLTQADLEVVAQVRDAYRELSPIPCTACRYCLPCPQGVAIPDILALLNDAHMYDDLPRQRLKYSWLDDGERADHCTACRECEDLCPQGIAIAGWMATARDVLGG
jgi:hypothetical protein